MATSADTPGGPLIHGHCKRPSLEPLLPPPTTASSASSSHRSPAARRLSTVSEIFGLRPERLQGLPVPLLDFIKSNLGFLYVALASGCFTIVNIIVAFLSTDEDTVVSTGELMFTRMSITALFCYITLKWKGDPHPALGPPDVRKLLVCRGVVGFFGIASQYYALSFLSVSDVTTINFLTPLATGVGAALILSEPYRLVEAVGAALSLGSVALVAKPSFIFGESTAEPILVDGQPVTEAERLTAIGGLLIGVIGGSGAYITIRFIGKRANALHSMIYFSYYSCIVSAILMIFVPSQRPTIPHNPKFIVMLLAIGFMGFFAQMCLTLGLQKENAGRAASATYLQLPLALVLDKIVFDQTPDGLSLLGSFLIICAAMTVMWYKQAVNKEEPSTPMIPSTTRRYASVATSEDDEDLDSVRDTSLFSPVPERPAPAGAQQ